MITIKKDAVVAMVAFAGAAGRGAGGIDGSRKIQLSEPAVLQRRPPGRTAELGTSGRRCRIDRRGRNTVATGKGRWIDRSGPHPTSRWSTVLTRVERTALPRSFQGERRFDLIDANTAVAQQR
jgi:hypothetical protein